MKSCDVIVYHDNCHDGITALWVAAQKFPHAEHYPGKYDEAPDLERLMGKHVLIVDFSWKLPEMLQVLGVAASLRVLDHHKTAKADLARLDSSVALFDMDRSGAGLAWDELIGGPRLDLVDYVEDRDLWRFKLAGCKEVHAACNSYPLTLEARDQLMARSVSDLAREGEAILRYHDRLVESAAKNATREVIAGYDVPSIACPNPELISDLGHRLCTGEPFAAVWVEKPDGTKSYSLRSTDEGMDVGEIAKSLGGGGHRNAAGFRVGP